MWISPRGTVETNLIRNHEVVGSIPAPLSGLRIWLCRELWCGSQMRLRSGITVALALIGPLDWEAPYALGVALKKKQKKIMTM